MRRRTAIQLLIGLAILNAVSTDGRVPKPEKALVPAQVSTVLSPLLPERQGESPCPVNVSVPKERQSIVDIAVSQWRRFGYQSFAISSDLRPHRDVAVRDRLFALVEHHLYNRSRPLSEFGPVTENEPIGAPAIAAYWRALRLNGSSRPALNAPWSAAFVSWVMCAAGFTNREFPRSAAHANYLAWFADSRSSRGRLFHLDTDNDTIPKPGDFVCHERDEEGLRPARRSPTIGIPMHCDIVIAFDTEQGRLFALGGNINNAVALSAYPWPKRHHGRRAASVLRFNRGGGDASVWASFR